MKKISACVVLALGLGFAHPALASVISLGKLSIRAISAPHVSACSNGPLTSDQQSAFATVSVTLANGKTLLFQSQTAMSYVVNNPAIACKESADVAKDYGNQIALYFQQLNRGIITVTTGHHRKSCLIEVLDVVESNAGNAIDFSSATESSKVPYPCPAL